MTNVDGHSGNLCGMSRSAHRPATSATARFRVGGSLGGRGLLRCSRGGTKHRAQADVERFGDTDERLESRVGTASLDFLPVLVADVGATRGLLLGKATRVPLGADSGADLTNRWRGALSNHGAE